ncbi:MAG: MFS transporter [Micromonosporaceae bacterium]
MSVGTAERETVEPAAADPATSDPKTADGHGGRRLGLISLLAAGAVSSVGSRMSALALPWLVLVTTGSPTRMGIVAGVGSLTYVLAGVFATPLANRIGIRRSAIAADLGSAATVGGIAAFSHIGFGVLVTLVAATGALAAIGNNTKNVLLAPAAAEAGTPMARVTAIFAGLTRTATIIGASIGGVLIAWLGTLAVVWIDAISFAACAGIVALLVRAVPNIAAAAEERAEDRPTVAGQPATDPSAGADRPAVKPEPYFTALAGGVRHLRGDRLLVGVVTMMFMLNLFNQASSAVFVPLWVLQVLHSPVALGFMASSFALGAIAGNVVFAALATRLPRYLTLVVGYFIGGAPRFFILSISERLEIVLAVTLICGLATSSVNPTIGALLYQRVPAALQSRVFGLCGAVSYGGLAVGGLVGAWFVAWLGLAGGIALAGLLYFGATLSPVVGHRTWRQMDEDGGRRPLLSPRPALRVVFAYGPDGWSVRARHGRRRVVPALALTSRDAATSLARLNVPGVLEQVERIQAGELTRTHQRAHHLRGELVRLEARLVDLRLLDPAAGLFPDSRPYRPHR